MCTKEQNSDKDTMDTKLSIQAIFEKLWECRDLEIEHYWHRMVFMTAFMVLSFASYGGLVVALIGMDTLPPFVLSNAGCFIISIVGMIVSIFWIMMSKGSKAWYEEYEHVITAFVKQGMNENRLASFAGHNYESIPNLTDAEINDFIWNTKAGGYSVSKVGIGLGHLALAVWIVIGGLHLWLIGTFSDWHSAVSYIESVATFNRLFYGSVLFMLFFWLYVKQCLFSRYFRKRSVA